MTTSRLSSGTPCVARNGHVVEASTWLYPVYQGGQQQPLCAYGYSGMDSDGRADSLAECPDNVLYWWMDYLMGHRAWNSGTPYDLYTYYRISFY